MPRPLGIGRTTAAGPPRQWSLRRTVVPHHCQGWWRRGRSPRRRAPIHPAPGRPCPTRRPRCDGGCAPSPGPILTGAGRRPFRPGEGGLGHQPQAQQRLWRAEGRKRPAACKRKAPPARRGGGVVRVERPNHVCALRIVHVRRSRQCPGRHVDRTRPSETEVTGLGSLLVQRSSTAPLVTARASRSRRRRTPSPAGWAVRR